MEEWAQHFPNVISTAGKLTINMELALMSNMDVMLVMDAANMHLASLVNIPVVSIWGQRIPVQALQDGISLRQTQYR